MPSCRRSRPLAGCDVREYARSRGAKLRLSIATGQVGGAYYVLGGGIAKVISDHVPNVQVTAELTAASVDNLKFLRAGQVDLGLTLGPSLADAFAGTGSFREFGRVPVRTLAALYTQPMHLVTLARHGITRVADLRGRVVSTQSPGSGTEVIALRMLEAAGLDPDRDLTRERLGPAQSADALKDGKLDAFFFSSGVPSPRSWRWPRRCGPRCACAQRRPPRRAAAALRRRAVSADDHPRAQLPRAGERRAHGRHRDAAGRGREDERDPRLRDHPRRPRSHRRAGRDPPRGEDVHRRAAAAGSPVPFHPGAIRYYRERGAWVA